MVEGRHLEIKRPITHTVCAKLVNKVYLFDVRSSEQNEVDKLVSKTV